MKKDKEKKTLQEKWEGLENWTNDFYNKKPVLTMFLTGIIVTLMGLFGIIAILTLLAFVITLHWAIVVFIVFPICVGIYFAFKQITDGF